jgi:hypothetical protein
LREWLAPNGVHYLCGSRQGGAEEFCRTKEEELLGCRLSTLMDSLQASDFHDAASLDEMCTLLADKPEAVLRRLRPEFRLAAVLLQENDDGRTTFTGIVPQWRRNPQQQSADTWQELLQRADGDIEDYEQYLFRTQLFREGYCFDANVLTAEAVRRTPPETLCSIIVEAGRSRYGTLPGSCAGGESIEDAVQAFTPCDLSVFEAPNAFELERYLENAEAERRFVHTRLLQAHWSAK